MRKLSYITGLLLGSLCVVHAQTQDSLDLRKGILAEARYLKSIYKTDEAIEKLSELVKPEGFDEDVLSELADCHFQSGDYESAAGPTSYYHPVLRTILFTRSGKCRPTLESRPGRRAFRPIGIFCNWIPFLLYLVLSVIRSARCNRQIRLCGTTDAPLP